jgi:hypothetical protein
MSEQWPECEAFFNLMQQYRQTPSTDPVASSSAYDAVKRWLRSSTEIKDVTRIGKAMPADAFRPYTEMSIRARVAMAAMQGLLAATTGDPAKEYTPEGCASAARRYADALLGELAK